MLNCARAQTIVAFVWDSKGQSAHSVLVVFLISKFRKDGCTFQNESGVANLVKL